MPVERVRRGADLTQNIAQRERADRPPNSSLHGTFRDHLKQSHVAHFNERVDKALAQIEEIGARLNDSLTLVDLRKYKQAIGALFKDLTTRMVEVKTEMEWDSQAWEHRTLVTVRKVDEELEKLTQLVLAQEHDRLAILEKIGEIKGMLIDLRM